MNRNFGTRFIPACALAAMAVLTACSDKQDVAGGASGDMGIVAKDIAGEALKGPFVKGSAVTVQGIDCKTMKFSDEVFEGKVKSDKGDFAFDDVTLSSTCAVFEATGKYRSEITGKESAGEITLHALTDLKDRKNVNVNLLTELEYERLMYLVTEKGKKFAEAKEQAEKEVLAAFDIAGSFEAFENLNIFESGDENAALLAVSVMMQAETDDAGLAKRVEKFVDSFAESGKWKDSDTKKAISEWAVEATANGKLDSIRKNVEAWNDGDKVAAFEKFIEAYADGDSVVLSSSSFRSSSSTLVEDLSSSSAKETGSEYDAATNTLKDLRDGQVYKTVKIGNQVWMAENLNYKTDSSFCYNDSAEYCAKYGRLYTWTAAMDACPDGWRLPGETDFKSLVKVVGDEKDAGTKLKSTSGWSDKDGKSGNGTDAFGFSALPAGMGNVGIYSGEDYTTYFWGSTECGSEGVPETGDGCASTMSMDYDDVDVSLKSYAAKDLWLSVRCVKGEAVGASSSSTEPALSSAGEIEDLSSSSSSSDNTTSSCAGVESSSSATSSSASDLVSSGEESSSSVGEFDWSIPKEAYLNPDISYGEITDARDGQVYKTVKIGNQTWMAENLNYADSVKTPSLLGHSWCHDNDPKKCKVAGRLYDWAAAIDTEKLYDDGDGIDCGIGAYCEVPDNTQGICPDGWHLPKSAEWKTLLAAAGTKNLKSQWGWLDDEAGTDSVGFSAVAYGYRKESTGLNRDVGEEAYFWSATDYSEVHAYSYRMSRGVKSDYKDYGFSIRCVKNEAGVISSSSSIASSSSVMLAALCKTETEDNCEYGTLTDSRDGRTYKTVVIGAQTWMAENLNFETDDSECYDNDASNCEKYGRLYSWGTAMDGAGAFSENGKGCGNANTCLETFPVRGICPSGWHLPDKYEWETLFIAARGYTRAGKILKSQSGWGDGGNGSDAVGFSVLFDGLGASVDDSRVHFWTSTETSGEVAYWIGFRGVNDYVTNLEFDKDNFVYVRCLKDE
ncbi:MULTISPECIES: fibrobacter succinogenes major paralogous domain-containing protein [unclassified Fibrobacter]|uniref:fibrobacter succinogenes major paralogous domain-containing protein n=1 Tax=unclassified Fibrobacter TaxID=2634177 RepID=UPI0025BB34AE|nr:MULTISPECIES: fibrobacter succinogenes major paralogous domain-containing protein [unclassified Fibrobacter]